MTECTAEESQRAYARIAGFMYLLVDALFVLGLFIVSRIEVHGNVVETAHRIMASERLYRIGLCLSLSGSLATLWLAVALYVTVKPLDRNLAIVALLCRLTEAVMEGICVIFGFVVLQLYVEANHAQAFDTNQLRALVELNSMASQVAFNVVTIFFSMGSIIFFYLFLKSNYIPRILSALGFFASMLVPVVGFSNLILPQYMGVANYGWLPLAIAEILTGLWLLIAGIKIQPRGNGSNDPVAA